jgi:uncharacterized protein
VLSRNIAPITAELYVVPVEDAYLVYAPLRQAAFLANAATVNRIVDLQGGSADAEDSETITLVEFLRRLEIVDGEPEAPPITRYSDAPQPTQVTLFLTTSCNLRCGYCYAAAGDTPRKAMPAEVARRGIDFVVANAVALGRDEIQISYHGGGEPTTNWPTLVASFHYARKRAAQAGLRARGWLTTNGVLTARKVRWITSHLETACVSFDGLPEVHDTYRRTRTGKGSSHQVLRTLRRFEDAGFPYALRMTVTSDQANRLAESIAYIFGHCHPQRIQVEPADLLGRWKDAPSVATQAFLDGFREAQAVARSCGGDIRFSAARVGTLSNHFCGVSQDSFSLTADGSVSACYQVFLERLSLASVFIYGRYDGQGGAFRFDMAALEHLRRQTVDRSAFCGGCFARWNCGGDCYHKMLTANGPGEFTGSERCHIVRELTKDQILDRIAAAGGLFWHEAPATPTAGIAPVRSDSPTHAETRTPARRSRRLAWRGRKEQH